MTPHQLRVIDYNNQIHNAYNWLWGLRRHHGIHCGYHDDDTSSHAAAVENMNRILAHTIQVGATDRVLDAGCGIAGSAIWLARHVGASVVGININSRQLSIAADLIARYNLMDRVWLCRGDYACTAFKDASFDVVWFLESFCCSEDKALALGEAHRILRPGGKIIIADAFLRRELASAEERNLVADWGRGWGVPSMLTTMEMNDLLGDIGFENIAYRDSTKYVISSSRRIFLTSYLLRPVGQILFRLGIRSELQMNSIVSGVNQYYARERGLGIYGIVRATKPIS